MNYGFVPDEIKEEDWVFGASTVPQDQLTDGDWSIYLPAFEAQSKQGIDTTNCTAYGSISAIEILSRRLFDTDTDYSERFLGIVSGTDPTVGGNSPHKVCEAIRKNGLLLEALLPFDKSIDSLDKYYSPKPMSAPLLKEAAKFLKRYEFSHEWLFTPSDWETLTIEAKNAKLKEALKTSPLGVSVYAWVKDNVYIKPDGVRDNHWCILIGFEDGKFWKVYDSYEDNVKLLDWNYNFGYCKRFFLKKKDVQESWLERILNYFRFFLQP